MASREHRDAKRHDDEVTARLYAAPFAKFTEVRKGLVKELRDRGERAAADELAKAKRPTRSASALNQVARLHPDELRAFVEAGKRVRKEEQRALAKRDAAAVRESGREMNAAIARVVALAARVVKDEGGAMSPALERAMTATLRAVAFASDEDVERVTRGVLVTDLEAPEDFGLFAGGGATHEDEGEEEEVDEREAPKRASAAEARKRREQARMAREEEQRREREIAKLAKVAEEAEREAARLERAAETAATRARETEEKAREARAEADAARTKAERARAAH